MLLRLTAFLVALFLALMAMPAFHRAERFAFEGRSRWRVRLQFARGILALAAAAAIAAALVLA